VSGLIAAGIAAVYPMLITADGALLSESLYGLLVRALPADRLPLAGCSERRAGGVARSVARTDGPRDNKTPLVSGCRDIVKR
jgi:hypothetical protein